MFLDEGEGFLGRFFQHPVSVAWQFHLFEITLAEPGSFLPGFGHESEIVTAVKKQDGYLERWEFGRSFGIDTRRAAVEPVIVESRFQLARLRKHPQIFLAVFLAKGAGA